MKRIERLVLAVGMGLACAAYGQSSSGPLPGSPDAAGNPGAFVPEETLPPALQEPPAAERPVPGPEAEEQVPGEGPASERAPAAFHGELAQYPGRWMQSERYGEVWVPAVPGGWRPYSNGQWVYSEQGWAWVAGEPWGWATFHFGRWYFDQAMGWAWVPGRVWAPAWVSWRYGGGYVGWAALPPGVGFSFAAGLQLGGASLGIAPGSYVFVAEAAMLSPRLDAHVLPPERNRALWSRTANITRYVVMGHRVFNRGVSVARIQQVTGRRVQVVRLATSPAVANVQGGAGQLTFHRPARTAAGARASAEFGRLAPGQSPQTATTRRPAPGAAVDPGRARLPRPSGAPSVAPPGGQGRPRAGSAQGGTWSRRPPPAPPRPPAPPPATGARRTGSGTQPAPAPEHRRPPA
jgi:hypothetical protein